MNFTPLSQVTITNCLRQCLLSLVLCMSLPLPPTFQDFYNSGLKGKTWQATPLFDCYLGAIP